MIEKYGFINCLICFFDIGPTDDGKMYKMVSAFHALNNTTSVDTDMYLGECQDYENYNQELVSGNLLMCSYSVRFVLGLSTIKQALDVAKNLSAVGVVFYMDPYVLGFQINPTPMDMPGIIIPSAEDSKVYKIIITKVFFKYELTICFFFFCRFYLNTITLLLREMQPPKTLLNLEQLQPLKAV